MQSQMVFGLSLLLVAALVAWACIGMGGTLQRMVARNAVRTLHKREWQERIEEAIARRRRAEREVFSWNGNRKFNVVRKVKEADDVFSFYLAAHDQKPIPPFHPGQFLTFRFQIPGQPKPVRRCYSLSDCPREGYYRITVKRVIGPDGAPGLASNFLLDKVAEGNILDVQAPRGHFYLDEVSRRGVVLIAGGVGLTPLLSMLNAIGRRESNRLVWLFFGVRDSKNHLMKSHLDDIIRENPNIRVTTCYSRPLPEDSQGKDFDHKGYVTPELIKETLPSNNFDFFVCGPSQMMTDMTSFLEDWDVPADHIHQEAFGPTSVAEVQGSACAVTPGATLEVTFARSGKKVIWKPESGSLLELAEAEGVPIDSGCRVGNCSTCLVAVRSGDVCYLNQPGAPPEQGSCLTCIAVPTSNVELDV